MPENTKTTKKHIHDDVQLARAVILTGGTIVGKVTSDGGYISGALSKEEQAELIGESISSSSDIEIIAEIDAGGSQNFSSEMVAKLFRAIKAYEKSMSEQGLLMDDHIDLGILITGGTDRQGCTLFYLSMLLPKPAFSIALTAAMCPPGGVAEGIGSYEDGPINIRHAELFLKQAHKDQKTQIVSVMENNAYSATAKHKPHGVEGAFKPNLNAAISELIMPVEKMAQAEGANIDQGWKDIIASPLPDHIPSNFHAGIEKILQAMESDLGLRDFVVDDAGQPIGFLSRLIGQNIGISEAMGYRGVGNGNLHEKIIPALENVVLNSECVLIRGTSAEGGIIDNRGEAAEFRMFAQFDDNNNVTNFMVPQGPFTTANATRLVAMIKAMGLCPPKRYDINNDAVYLEKYKSYIADVTKCIYARHPLIEAARILENMQA